MTDLSCQSLNDPISSLHSFAKTHVAVISISSYQLLRDICILVCLCISVKRRKRVELVLRSRRKKKEKESCQ